MSWDFCDSYSEFYAETFPKAAKVYKCCECHKPIQVGEKHLYARGKAEGDFWQARQCLYCRDFCMEIRDKVNDRFCLPFGALNECLSDMVHEFRCELKKMRREKHLRSMIAAWLWESEGRKVFWQRQKFPHRLAEI
jgi:hypothetical protein